MDDLDAFIEKDVLAGLLALASAASGGAAVGLVDPEGLLLAGRSAGPIPLRSQPIAVDGRVVAALTGEDTVSPELLVLVGRSLELVFAGGRDRSERERVAHELAIGRRIQLALMPRHFPEIDGWTFAAHYEAAREVGGDLFDAFVLRNRPDRLALLIADVTGKGIPAALLMADVRALLHAAADNADGPADALGRVNSILVHERATSLMVTAALLEVDTLTGDVRLASAGHESPLIARTGRGVGSLDAPGPILGAFPDVVYSEQTARLGRGDSIILYTDGVTETRDEHRRFYGDDRLLAAIGSVCGATADVVSRTIVGDVAAFRGEAELFDDLTLLVVERRPAADEEAAGSSG
jgi:sigma-B regulation protein RsbU (phosphoserine phosphatase)